MLSQFYQTLCQCMQIVMSFRYSWCWEVIIIGKVIGALVAKCYHSLPNTMSMYANSHVFQIWLVLGSNNYRQGYRCTGCKTLSQFYQTLCQCIQNNVFQIWLVLGSNTYRQGYRLHWLHNLITVYQTLKNS